MPRDNLCFNFQAMNPSTNIQEGQSVTLTCSVHVKGVGMKNIVWYKDGDRIYDSYKISLNRFLYLENNIDMAVSHENITWYVGRLTQQKVASNLMVLRVSLSRLMLTIEDAGASDRGTFTCEATKEGVSASGVFRVSVFIPAVCTHDDGNDFEEGTVYQPNEVHSLSFFIYSSRQ